MPQDEPESGIRDWEKGFWTLHGLLGKMQPEKKDSDPNKNPYVIQEQKEALDSYRKAAEKRRGASMKTSATTGKRTTTRKTGQRKTSSGK
jgi:hypothetical protein